MTAFHGNSRASVRPFSLDRGNRLRRRRLSGGQAVRAVLGCGLLLAAVASYCRRSLLRSSDQELNAVNRETRFPVTPATLPPVVPPRRLYECGWPLPRLRQALFGTYLQGTSDATILSAYRDGPSPTTPTAASIVEAGQYHRAAPSSPNDILLFGMHGECNGTSRTERIKPDYVESHFAGKALFVNGEPYASIFPLSDYPCGPRFGCPNSTHHLYQIGSVTEHTPSAHGHIVPVFYAAVILLEHFADHQRRWLFDHSQKRHMHQPAARLRRAKYHVHPTETFTPHGIRNAVVYMSRQCIEHRQVAAASISTVLPLHCTSRCKPRQSDIPEWLRDGQQLPSTQTSADGNIPSIIDATMLAYKNTDGRQFYWHNYRFYSAYKYCLCMENSKVPGYISEKIVLAFLGGCVPIYWGTTEVFDIFNPQAFIYYDVDDPAPALDRLRALEANYSAYEEMLVHQPILRDGSRTVERYFSLSDSIGDGGLRKRILTMLQL